MINVVETGENQRVITIGTYEVRLNRLDPHGFWYFQWESGNPPEKLSGAFTNLSQAYEFL
jgi:hypothetical protein